MNESSSASSQLNVTVQPNHDIMSIATFSYENLQKAASVASEAHTLANFMDAPTINFVNTQLLIHNSRIRIDGKVTDILAEMIRLNSADSMTTMSDGTTQAANIFYCNEKHRVTNLVDDTVYRNYYSAVISLNQRHATATVEKIKEMIDKLIKNLGKDCVNPENTQYQVLELQTRVKTMPESGRRDLNGFLNQISAARLELIKHIASCNNMKMLKEECLPKRARDHNDDDFERKARDNKRPNKGQVSTSNAEICNHCGKKHAQPCGLLTHPDCNPDANIAWSESDKGKAWKDKGFDVLQARQLLTGQVWENPNPFHLRNNNNNNRNTSQYNNNHNNNRNHGRGRRY